MALRDIAGQHGWSCGPAMVNHMKLGLQAGIPAQSSDVPLERDAPQTAAEFAIQPRVPPESVGSGISFRRLPRCDFEQVRKTCQFYESKGAGHYDAPSARYLYDLSREVQASLRAIETDIRAKEEQHHKVLDLFEQWNDVLATAKTRFQATSVMTPHMLLGMVDSSNKKIAELEEALRSLRERHKKFETAISTSVDSQTVAVRTHFRQELEAMEQAHRKKVESMHEQSAQEVSNHATEMTRGVQLAYHAMEREKSELMQSYNRRLEQAAQKLNATTVECSTALERMRLEQQKQSEVYALQLESALAAASRRHAEELEVARRESNARVHHLETQLQQLRVQVAEKAVETSERGQVPPGLVALLRSVADRVDGATPVQHEAVDAAEERARIAETQNAQLNEQAEQLRRRVSTQDRLLQVQDAALEEGVTLRREKAFLLAQLEEAQMVIDVAEGKVDAKAGAALARETGTLRVNPSAPFVVSTQT